MVTNTNKFVLSSCCTDSKIDTLFNIGITTTVWLYFTGAIVDPSAPKSTEQQDPETLEKTGLRLCEHCYNLVELRKQVQDSRNAKTVLVTAYEQMRSLMEQARPAVAMYEKVCLAYLVYNLFIECHVPQFLMMKLIQNR